MRMLQMNCRKTLRNGISNEAVRSMTEVEKIEEFLGEHRLRWFGHVERIDDERAPVKAQKFCS